MIYKYEMACKEAGLSEEKVVEIRRMFDNDKKKLKRENERMEKENIRYFSMNQVEEDDDFGEYSIADPRVDVEMSVLHKM